MRPSMVSISPGRLSKGCSSTTVRAPIGRYREHGLPHAIRDYEGVQELELWSFSSAEAQLAALADDIAYDAHDIDDGLRAELFALDDLGEVPLAAGIIEEIRRMHPGLDTSR